MTQPPVSQNEEAIAELTERARAISRDASTKVTSAFRDMISAGAGIAGFAVESAKDLVQYMVRRGQMTADEAERLIKEAEAAHLKRPKAERERIAASRAAAEKAAFEKRMARVAAENALPANKPLSKTVKTAPLKSSIPPEPMKAETTDRLEKPAKLGKPAKADKPAKMDKPVAKAEVKASAAKKAPVAKKAAGKPAAKKAAKKKK